jgi:murein DD-endopeptidase MepM/ murein hydrolase activator NlpD
VYVVEKGETLEDIAKKFDVDSATLKKANRLHGDTLTEGQRLTIPPAPSGSFLPPNHKEGAGDQIRKEKPRVKDMPPPATAPHLGKTLVWPVAGGAITSHFGIRKNGKHDGMDISAPEGAKIVAAAEGTVIFSGWGPSGYGNMVVIKHSENLVTVYAHNSKNLAERGTTVKQGQVIALVGHSGRTTASHCHFEVRVNRVAFDPMEYLPKK